MQSWDGKERRDELREKIDDLHKDVKLIMHILNGNGEPGLVAKVDMHEKHITQQIKRTQTWFNTVITTVTLIVIGVIALKLGLHWNG